MWFTGAGVKGWRVLGSTDEFGLRPAENPLLSHDVNETILRMMGLDHAKLTYFYQGRDMRLTDVHMGRASSQTLCLACDTASAKSAYAYQVAPRSGPA